MKESDNNNIYSRNALFFSQKDMNSIKKAKIAIAGVGGLGCIVAEILARMGVSYLLLMDNGIVDMPDLGRQSLYNLNDVGKRKVDAAKNSIQKKIDTCEIESAFVDIQKDDLSDILPKVNGIADCLDNYKSRFALENYIDRVKFLVHGGVENDYGQITTIMKDKTTTLKKLYSNMDSEKSNDIIAVTTPAVFVVGSLVAQEIVNNILKKPKLLNELLVVELSDFSFFKIELN